MPTTETPVVSSPAKRAAEIGEEPLCKGRSEGWITKQFGPKESIT